MKTIGRILIILAAFAIVAGLMVTVVNASSANSSTPNGARQFRPDGQNGTRPEREGREGAGGTGWIFGLIKNVGVMAVLVALITWPKSIAKKNKKRAVEDPQTSSHNL